MSGCRLRGLVVYILQVRVLMIKFNLALIGRSSAGQEEINTDSWNRMRARTKYRNLLGSQATNTHQKSKTDRRMIRALHSTHQEVANNRLDVYLTTKFLYTYIEQYNPSQSTAHQD